MRLNLSIISKLTLLVVGAVTLTALAVNEVYVRGTNHILVDRAIDDLAGEAEFFLYPLGGKIDRIRDDARLLVEVPATQEIVRTGLNSADDPQGVRPPEGLEDWLAKLGTIFTGMLHTREYYRQIRLIGVADDGKEILRVERFGNRIERTPANKLQQKGAERYFRDAASLSPGETHISEAELNKEYGKISNPHVLTLRVAAPVFDNERELFGIVIINIDFGALLQDIRRNLAENRGLSIINAKGDYFLHSDRSMLYATDLGHEHRIQRDKPGLLDVMGNPKQEKAILLPENAGGHVLAFQKYHYDARNPDNSLGIVVEAPYADVIAKTEDVQRQGFLFSGIIVLVAAAASIALLRLLIRPLNRMADAVVRYRKGERDIVLPAESPDEIGLLAREFAAMMKQKGEEDWVKENLLVISRSLIGFKELSGFANSMMEMLTSAVGAQVGVLYISGSFAHRHTVGETETLTYLGGWGYKARDGEDHLPRSFKWGEGLIGSCARSRTRMLITDIPQDYLRIGTALGEATPRQLLLLPVLYENSLVGVIELASVGAFSEVHLAFLEQLSFNIGVILNTICAGMRTLELLAQTRQTAEELQSNEEELKTQQEELEASNEEMEEKTRALEEQNAQIRRQSQELSESKRLIEEKAREVELSSRYKSEFLANMSHELRTPLNSLLILARGLSLNEEGNLTAEQMEEASVIYSGGLELLSLINDVLDLSKVEAGKITITKDIVSIRDVAKKLSHQFQPVAQQSGVAFHLRVDESLPETLQTDRQRLEQILKNLLSNAFKFTQAGTVTLNIHPVAGGGPERRQVSRIERRAIGFSVIDTGIGIEASKLKDIFEAFQQEDGSIDRHYGGTGLGLTIARKFAHLLEGEIRVESEKGQGSRFTLFLPLASALEEPTIPAPLAAADMDEAGAPVTKPMPKAAMKTFIPDDSNAIGANDKVLLIIEDDPASAGALMKIARKRRYKCLAAGDGKSGLLLAAEHPVTAILLDLQLPDMDGMHVLDQLKHNLRTRHIPVHIVSGVEMADAMMPLRKGAVGFRTKPVHPEELDGVFASIETVLRASLKRVLVVEDHKATQAAIESLLKHKAVEIVTEETGSAALAQLRETHFDCVILDLKLPDMTGLEWLEAVEKEADRSNTPPIIIYTAKELSEEENRALSRHTGSIVIKGASSSERLLDEVTLFLHSVEATLSTDQQVIIRMQHDPDQVLQSRTVLLVDDDLRNTFALSKLLKKRGMTVVLADNGQMALEKLKADKTIELVVMDIMMPVMDGYQAIQEIRKHAPWRHLPIIALTARAMPEEQERCIEAGANDYLVKPVDIERLLTLLRVWLFKQERAA